MEQEERPGVIANGRFYWFTRHFGENRARDEHLEATDELIISALSEPDYVQDPEGNRTVYWKRITESGEDYWWLLVVIVEETGGPQVLSAYRDTRGRGERLWGIQQI